MTPPSGETAGPGSVGTPHTPGPPPIAARTAWLIAGGVTLFDAIAVGYAFQPERAGSPSLLLSIGGTYLLVAALAIFWRHRLSDGTTWLRPKAGDLTLGAGVAAVMYLGAMAGHLVLTPHGTPREAWIIRVYLLFGDPAELSHFVGAGAFLVAVLEEAVWRGLVMKVLADTLGAPRALVISSILFALAHLPTVLLLADPTAGPNPIIVLAALGCSLVWGWLTIRTGRLSPALFAHGFFTWAVIEFPLWRP